MTREQFIDNISDIESVFLIEKFEGDFYLLSDMEYAGEKCNARVEIMDFKLDECIPIIKSVSECRSHYAGKISFIEYDFDGDTTELAVRDFMEFDSADICYIKSHDEYILNELKKFSFQFYFVNFDSIKLA